MNRTERKETVERVAGEIVDGGSLVQVRKEGRRKRSTLACSCHSPLLPSEKLRACDLTAREGFRVVYLLIMSDRANWAYLSIGPERMLARIPYKRGRAKEKERDR